MLPELQPDDYLLIRTFFTTPRVGDIVVIQHDHYGRLVKTVTQLLSNGQCLVSSFNPQGLSGSEIGPINGHQIIGIKLFHIKQPQR